MNLVVKPIIALPSPRKVDIVIETHEKELKDIPHLWVKYIWEKEAYAIIRDYFLKHNEYTHLIICPDDLIVKREHYDALVTTLEKEDYPVFSGICNKSMIAGDLMAICIDELPNVNRRKGRRFHLASYREMPKGIIQVKFAGFPFMFIRRDIVEKIEFESDRKWNPYRRVVRELGFDLPFCHNCNELGIPIYVDSRVVMLHLLGASLSEPYGNQVENLLVGKEPPRVYFQQDDKIEDLTEHYS